MANEVCSIVDTDQFSAGASVDKCGFYATASLKYAGKPGQAPTGSADQVTSWADSEYVAYDGPDVASNDNGMTMATLFSVLKDAGLHWQVIGSNELSFETARLTADYIRAWLKLGYAVILAVAESVVNDVDLGGSPYAWDTTGLYHVIIVTGIDGNALLCHDTASIDNNGVRPGPRKYDAAALESGLTSATAVVLPWLQRPPDNYDPIASGGLMIPQGWHDNGTKLVAPNGHTVVLGFRGQILNTANWDPGNQPLEEEHHADPMELHNPQGGAGQVQCFRDLVLVYKDKVAASAAGAEVKAAYDLINIQKTQFAAQQTLIATLQAELKAAPVDVAGAQAALKVLGATMLNEAQTMAALATALHITL